MNNVRAHLSVRRRLGDFRIAPAAHPTNAHVLAVEAHISVIVGVGIREHHFALALYVILRRERIFRRLIRKEKSPLLGERGAVEAQPRCR